MLEGSAGEAALDVPPAPDDADCADYFRADVMTGEFFKFRAARLVALQNSDPVNYFAAEAEILIWIFPDDLGPIFFHKFPFAL